MNENLSFSSNLASVSFARPLKSKENKLQTPSPNRHGQSSGKKRAFDLNDLALMSNKRHTPSSRNPFTPTLVKNPILPASSENKRASSADKQAFDQTSPSDKPFFIYPNGVPTPPSDTPEYKNFRARPKHDDSGGSPLQILGQNMLPGSEGTSPRIMQPKRLLLMDIQDYADMDLS